MTLPETWKNKYVVTVENAATDMEAYVTFYHKSTYDGSPSDMRMGRLFSIVIFSAEQWRAQKEDITSMCEGFGTVEHGNGVFYFAGPTDVQFDPENKAATEEYQAMSGDITGIVKTMAFEK